ncbi:hypothetical protein ACVBEH_22615 [Roseateles sp. GG27B]
MKNPRIDLIFKKWFCLIAAAILGSAPLLVAAFYGFSANRLSAGGFQFGYFAIIAGFIPLTIAATKLMFLCCSAALNFIFTATPSADLAFENKSRRFISINLVVAGVVFTQAFAQIVRYVIPSPPLTKILDDWSVALTFAAIQGVAVPLIETSIFFALAELGFRCLGSKKKTIFLIATVFALLHGMQQPYWALSAAVLFAYSAAIYIKKIKLNGKRVPAIFLVFCIHSANNLFGIFIITGRELLF